MKTLFEIGPAAMTAHAEYAYSPRQGDRSIARYHAILDRPLRFARFRRDAGDALCKPRRAFWGLSPGGTNRVSCPRCLELAERYGVTLPHPDELADEDEATYRERHDTEPRDLPLALAQCSHDPGSHSAEQYQRQCRQIPRSPVLPGASPMKDAPQVLQQRSILVAGLGSPRADFWRIGESGTGMIISSRAGIVRAYECGTTEPAAPREAAGGLSQVGGGGSGI